MSSMSFLYSYVVAQGHFNEGFHKKFDQEICILTQMTKTRVLTQCVTGGLSKSFSWSIIFILSFQTSLFKDFLKKLRGIRVLKLDHHPPTQLAKIRVLSLIRSSSTFWCKLGFMWFHVLLCTYDWKIEVQFEVKLIQLDTKGKMVILVKISQSKSWPSGLLVNHQFNDALFIFQHQFDHKIKRSWSLRWNLFMKKP